jgi:outer membrane protein insertion porin family
MKVGLTMLRGGLVAALIAVTLPATLVAVTSVASPAAAQSASSIVVEGNRRVEAETIRTYFKPGPGGRLDSGSINDGLRALYETGLFQDVRINQVGGRLVVTVVENPVISRVIFEGNKKVKDEQLSTEVQSKPRGSLSRPMVQSDTQRITEIYRRQGRYDVTVVPQIIEQPNNRVDLIFEITEGGKTGVKSIDFVGNSAVSSYRLRDIIKTRETNLLSFLGSGDIYDPDRVEADRDLIRRYYLKNGYADVQVVAALTEYDPEKRGFLVTFKIEEGQQYRVASIELQSNIRGLDPNSFRSFLRLGTGSVYNGEAIEKSVEEITVEASRRGYAFANVRPRGERNFQNATVSIVLVIEEGPRVYVERINVRGNTRTKDYVVRREFDIAEGDAYNRALVDRAERRLKNLDYFKTVKILTEPGSSADRVIIVVDLEEKSTGDFSVSGGYSTSDGFLAEVSVSERNLLGTGLYAKAGVQYGQRVRGYNVSIVEPFLLGYRVAGGLDFFQRQQLPSSYVSYETTTIGGSARLGFALREDLSMQVRYSLYRQSVSIDPTLRDCNNNAANPFMAFNPTPAFAAAQTPPLDLTSTNGLGCYFNGEASLPVKIELANGPVWTSAVGYTLAYNTLDNNKDPNNGLLVEFRQDVAGLGGDVKYLRSTIDGRFYFPVVSDVVGVLRGQAGHIMGIGGEGIRMLDHFQMGPNLVRGFAPVGLGPRDITLGTSQDALGGTMYWGASAELQMPFWFLPKEAGLKGAVYADVGSLWDYRGPTVFPATLETVNVAQDNMIVRASIGAGIIWSSPFGPLRFDYAVPIAKGPNDRTQVFRFGGSSAF